jgi:uncharacterized protein with PIN domain
MKFLCDDNLGKLAKYLRLIGFDTAFVTPISNPELISKMLKENRLVITRDKRLADRIEANRVVVVDIDSPEEQLWYVIKILGLQIIPENFFSRCLICNEICRETKAEEIREKVFPYILKTKNQFRRCPKCDRIYWQGSHYYRMMDRLRQLFENQ